MAPRAYAQLQVLQQAVEATKSLDDGKLADYIRANTFKTVLGDVKFGTKRRVGGVARAAGAVPERQGQRRRPVQGHVDPGRGGAGGVRVGQADLSLREGEVRRSVESGSAASHFRCVIPGPERKRGA